MTRDEALGLLGVKPSATHDEIRARFREVAKNVHPDQGGDPLAMAQLYAARELALGRTASLGLVPIDDVRSLVATEISAASARYEIREEKARAVTRLRERRISPLKRLKRATATFGLAAAVLALTVDQVLPLVEQRVGPLTKLYLIGFAFLSGLAFAIASWRQERLEEGLEGFTEEIDNKNDYMRLMQEVLPHERRQTFWTEIELERFVSLWKPVSSFGYDPFLPTLIRFVRSLIRIGRASVYSQLPSAELARLLLAVGREQGLLEEKEEYRDREGFLMRYRLSLPKSKKEESSTLED